MGRGSSIMDQRCKKHPSHKQSKGVCPSCLREKLSHLSTLSSSSTTNLSSSTTCSSLSPYSLSDSNLSSIATASPPDNKIMTKTKSFSFLLKGLNSTSKPLKKSRSLAFVVEEEKQRDKKKKGKFWSTLLRRRSKEEDGGLTHSKTVKGRSSANKWMLFS
ncbi:uncharacterized protein A4U43_C03F18620 [Asparagus officinalis]|uniref:Uncharacterized protein n=1 Tax=Asparagus officinalis TaxID=4686 RepID=A0A5P1FBY5_ASPOF|nr:uncharacterized protein LOC109832253 [Asparagus officinalis]ONK75602.1 uncharacterized protein A4U43_C03F18620 [Asparagus officinalis]